MANTFLQKIFRQYGPFIIIIVYLVFRIINLTSLPIFNDEGIYLDWGWRMLHDPTIPYWSITNGDGKPPFLMWIFGYSQELISDPLWAGRIISVLTGLSTCIGLYFLAKEYFNKKVAYIAPFLYILIPLFSFYDRQALMESSEAAVSIWSLFLFLRMIRKPDIKKALLLGIVLGIGYFIKGTALSFIALIILLTGYEMFTKKSKKLGGYILTALVVSQIVLLPLYMQPRFWDTLGRNAQYVLTLPELIRFPIVIWFQNIITSTLLSFWYLTPLIFISAIAGIISSLRTKDRHQKLIIHWFFGGLVLFLLVVKSPSSRYVDPFLPLIPLFSAYALIHFYDRYKLGTVFFASLTALILFLFICLQIFSPLTYFHLYNTLYPNNSDYSGYVTGRTSGYGVQEAIDYINQQAKTQSIIAVYRLDAGNPESAIADYFERTNRARYLDTRVIPFSIAPYDCLNTNGNLIIYVTRDGSLGGMDKFFHPIKRFYKPDASPNFVGIEETDPNCKGNALSLGDGGTTGTSVYQSGISALPKSIAPVEPTIPTGNVSASFLLSQPEGTLYYPNSKIYRKLISGEIVSNGQTIPANAGAIMISNDPSQKIYNWYITWLEARGWKNDPNSVSQPLPTQLTRINAERGQREKFYVAMDNPKALEQILGVTFPPNVTVFEFRYIIQ